MSLPTTARAAILTALNKPLSIDTIELPEQLDVGQVLVKVLYSGICGSQLGEIAGVKGPDKYLPHLLGHEGCGEVLTVGAGVSHVQKGDKVVMHWRPGNGINAKPAMYRWNDQPLNAGLITSFNNYAVVSENRLTAISKTFDNQLAPLLGCAVTTGFGVVLNNAKLQIGESIAVFGAGGIGLNIIQAAAMVSAYPIIAIDTFAGKLDLAKQLGATHLIDTSTSDAKEEIKKILDSELLDVAIDNTGNTHVIESCYQLTHSKGKIILVGVPKHDQDIRIHSLPLHFGKEITGSHGGESQPASDIPRLIKLHRAGKLALKELITDHFKLEDINTAIEKMRNGSIRGRCLIHFEHSC
ncbi:MAG: zinc-binding dehydrogenase [Pseudomonadales bacterium]